MSRRESDFPNEPRTVGDLMNPKGPPMNPTDEALVERVARAICLSDGLDIDTFQGGERDAILRHASKHARAALEAIPAEKGVGVKPLEWAADRYQEFSYRSETAKTSIGKYEAFSFIAAEKPVAGWTSTLSAQEGKSVSLDAAKAAAQADYEARIRSALLPASGAVASGGVEATEVKQIKDWLLERNRDHLIAAQDRTRVMFRKDGDAEMFLDAAILLVHLARLSVSTPPEVDAGQ